MRNSNTATKVKLPKLPTFTRQQYLKDDDTPPPQVRMSVAQWAAVPRNPFQKEKRDERRNIDHLFVFIKEHAIARMGIYPDGRVCKIDCHTRGRLYHERPELVDNPPSFLNVECFPVRDDAHAAERFKAVDNKKTAKNASDDVHGAFRLAGVSTESSFFQNANNIKAGLGYAYGVVMAAVLSELSPHDRAAKMKTVTIDDQVAYFINALNALDSVDVNRAKLPAPFITAFLIAYEKHGADVVPFFKRINEGTHGVKLGKKMCPIAAIEYERDTHKGAGQVQHMLFVTKVLGALDRYLEGNFSRPDYKPKVNMQKVMTVDLDQYLVRAKARRTGRTKKKSDGGNGFTR